MKFSKADLVVIQGALVYWEHKHAFHASQFQLKLIERINKDRKKRNY